MTRCLLLVLDGVGAGHAPDAAAYGDAGADTLGHLLQRGLSLPTLWSLGLGRVLGVPDAPANACWGRMRPRSPGKDSTTGHWELAGIVLAEPFRVFDRFPDELVQAIEREAGTSFLGNCAASGTGILEELGSEHLRLGHPILYTSADSVLQIAAHVGIVPLERLYALCEIARRHADTYRIGRVIARPFDGTPSAFSRTPDRHDFSAAPPPNVLDALRDAGWAVHGVGKTADLFSGRGFSSHHPTASNADGMRRTAEVWSATQRGLVFTNLIDFDTLYGHRRDPDGFAAALVEFDRWFGRFLENRQPGDLIVVTADHGNDPTFRGTDHTREAVPLLAVFGDAARELGTRESFADIAATLAARFGLPPWPIGRPLPL